jgi:hypothetical protein
MWARAAASVLTALAASPALIAPAQAQGVFDMGVLTNTISQDHVTQSEAARARRQQPTRDADAAQSAKTRANCAKARQWAAEGRKFAELPRVLGLCAQLGY